MGDSIALVVDPGANREAAAAFLAAAARVTDRPIRYAVLTHWHPDHAMAVTCQAKRPFRVVAHPETRRALVERAGRIGRCAVNPPDIIVASRQRFDLGGRVVEVIPLGHAHTAGDLAVWEPREKVLAAGDVFMHASSPDMGEARPTGWARVLDSLVATGPQAVVAGHFGPSTPKDLARFRDYLAALVSQVTTLVSAGVADSVVAGRLDLGSFADFAQYPQFGATFAANAAAVLRELRTKPGGG